MNLARAVYRLGIRVYGAAISVAAHFSPKAKAWVDDRSDLWPTANALPPAPPQGRVWVHCASLGEFEMALPVMEALQDKKPGISVVVTFFSPSGFRVRKKFAGCDAVLCLPLDTPANARRFVKAINPTLAIWVKYDLWWEHLEALHNFKVPIHLICAQFRRGHTIFRWPRWYGKPILDNFKHIHTIDQHSCNLLKAIDLHHCSVAGDTRYDRVAQLAANAQPIDQISTWAKNGPLVVCGSTWPADEAILNAAAKQIGGDVKWLIVPHETDPQSVAATVQRFAGAITYTQLENGDHAQMVVMDRIGLLGRAYQHATVAYVGGAFGSGLHNILEATAYGLPVVFGPKTNRFPDADELVELGLAFKINDADSAHQALTRLANANLSELKNKIVTFMSDRTGATARIIASLGSD